MKVTFPRYMGIGGERQKERGRISGPMIVPPCLRGVGSRTLCGYLCGCSGVFYKMPSGSAHAEGRLYLYYTYLQIQNLKRP